MLNNFLRVKILLTIFSLVLLDQILKNAALAFLVIPRSISAFLSLEIFKNFGIAFGLPVAAGVFYFAVFVFLAAIFWGRKKGFLGDWGKIEKRKICAVCLIAAGALGNIIDRVRWGYIVDYINIGNILVFNLADVLILAGAAILLEELFPDTGKGKIKKNIYISLFMILGSLVSFLIHAAVEIWYIGLLAVDFPKYSLGFGWPDWHIIHSIGTVILFAFGLFFGYSQGKYWWKVLYEKE